jgi:hypothetical protein
MSFVMFFLRLFQNEVWFQCMFFLLPHPIHSFTCHGDNIFSKDGWVRTFANVAISNLPHVINQKLLINYLNVNVLDCDSHNVSFKKNLQCHIVLGKLGSFWRDVLFPV